MVQKATKKKIKKKISKNKKKLFVKKKKKAKGSTTESRHNESENSQSSPSLAAPTEDRRRRPGVADHLRQYQFKPGHKPLPGSGRKKGSVSITTRIRRLMELPVRFPGKKDIRQDYVYADLLAEMAMKAAANQDFRFFKELWDRTDGKVPDHVVLESTRRMVAQEAATLAQDLLGVVGETIDGYLDDDRAEAFMTALGERLATKYEDDPDAGRDSEEVAAMTQRGAS